MIDGPIDNDSRHYFHSRGRPIIPVSGSGRGSGFKNDSHDKMSSKYAMTSRVHYKQSDS